MTSADPAKVEENSANCPACGQADREARGEKNGCALHLCRACYTLYSLGAPLNYDGYYHDGNLAVPDFIQDRVDQTLATFARYRKTNRLLDIGCGAGSLLQAGRRAGWDAEGLEVSKPAAEHLRSQGFKVFCGELSAASYPIDYFDVITASELLEHLANPLLMLEQIARILKPGGLLWATTPNGRGLSARVLGTGWSIVCPPEHLQVFSPTGIRRMIKRAGFGHIRIVSSGCNPLEIWQALRSRSHDEPKGSSNDESAHADAPLTATNNPGYNRVASSYRLNEAMLRNPLTRVLKATVNAALGTTGLGDTIRIMAEK